MTDRTKVLIVTLDETYRVDDAEIIMNAIKMLKGVDNVIAAINTIDDNFKELGYRQKIKDDLCKIVTEAIYNG